MVSQRHINQHGLFIGIDLGTSGVRACAIDQQKRLLHQCNQSLPEPQCNISDQPQPNGQQPAQQITQNITQNPQLWWQATLQVLRQLFVQIDPAEVLGVSVNGTSGTVLACDAQGTPLSPALMYNHNACQAEAQRIAQIAPAGSGAQGASSGLAKLIYLQQAFPDASRLLHQADWIAAQLSGEFAISDSNNALKTGYDPQQAEWPVWLDQLGIQRSWLPRVVSPGTVIGPVRSALLQNEFAQDQLNRNCQIISGTTDSIAAFIATGASQVGEAVTSLGSTLVIKVISDKPVAAAEYGIYSHKLGDHWLAGGASNSGGAVLRQYFSQQQLDQLSPQLKPEQPTGLNYYPLLRAGERFPINDPQLPPRLQPEAESQLQFFQGLLEGMAAIEHQGYKKLQALGASYPTRVISAGGGSRNSAWNRIREQQLGVPVCSAQYTEACYGSALLARRGYNATQTHSSSEPR